jgi:hypothetical protein
MIAHKKEFFGGVIMMAVFAVVLIVIFMPIFGGQNGLNYLDNLYNTISKGSAYYMPKVKEEAAKFDGTTVDVTLKLANADQAQETDRLFNQAGALVNVSGIDLKVRGDLAQILNGCINDADAMYYNDGEKVSGKYGFDERRVLFDWWTALKGMGKALEKQKKFKEAKVIDLTVSKAVETSYNYYQVEPKKIGEKIGIVIFSLVFYVIYTLWYGFAIMFMFEGWGLRLEH